MRDQGITKFRADYDVAPNNGDDRVAVRLDDRDVLLIDRWKEVKKALVEQGAALPVFLA